MVTFSHDPAAGGAVGLPRDAGASLAMTGGVEGIIPFTQLAMVTSFERYIFIHSPRAALS